MSNVTIWKKDLEIKVAFETDHVIVRKCKSQQEFDTVWETVMALCHCLGKGIEIGK